MSGMAVEPAGCTEPGCGQSCPVGYVATQRSSCGGVRGVVGPGWAGQGVTGSAEH